MNKYRELYIINYPEIKVSDEKIAIPYEESFNEDLLLLANNGMIIINELPDSTEFQMDYHSIEFILPSLKDSALRIALRDFSVNLKKPFKNQIDLH